VSIDPTYRTTTPEYAVSWDGTAAFTGTYDVLDGRVLNDTLAIQYGRDSAKPLGESLIPTATWVAWNADRLLSPEWAGSPLYQLILPGKPTRVRFFVGSDVTDYDAATVDYDDPLWYDEHAAVELHHGLLDKPSYDPSLGMSVVTMTSVGNLSRLSRPGAVISLPLAQNVRVDQAITLVLDEVGWPLDHRDLALADTLLDWFWVEQESALEVLARLQHTEGSPSLIYESCDGILHFENRNYRSITARSTTSNVYVSDGSSVPNPGTVIYHSGIAYDQPFEDVCNEAVAPIVRRVRQSLQKVWEYGGPLVLAPGVSKLVTATLDEPTDGFVGLTSTVDWTISGPGSLDAVAFEDIHAKSIGIRFLSVGGCTVVGVTSNGPQLRGTPCPVVSEAKVSNSIDTTASIAKYDPFRNKPQSQTLQNYPEISEALGTAICDAMVTLSSEVRSVIRLRVLNPDLQHAMQQVARRPSDRISVISLPLGVQSDYWVEAVEYRFVPEGVETVFTCSWAAVSGGPPVVGAAIWDSGVWDDAAALWGN
jgi:hypothetical protein